MGSSQSSGKVTSHDRTILDLKVQRDKLKQYQKRLQISLTNEHEVAKQAMAAGQKSKALTALRQKKYQEQLLGKTDAQLINLQELLSTIEYTQMQNTILKSLDKGSEVLKELHKEMSLDRAEGIMDRVGHGIQAQRDIDEALMTKISPEEEEQVQQELAALEREALGVQPETVPSLPSVPSSEPKVEEPTETGPTKITQAPEHERVALPA